MGRISKCRRYVIDVTVLNSLSLGGLGGVQCFGESGVSGRARTMRNKFDITIHFKGEMVDLFAPKRFDSKAADLEEKFKK